MKKIINFLKESNRWLHLICGALAALAVAFLSLIILVDFDATIAIPLIAIQAVSFIAVVLEMKDVQGGVNLIGRTLPSQSLEQSLFSFPFVFSVTSNLDMGLFKML